MKKYNTGSRKLLIQAFKLRHNMYDADYSTYFDKASGSTTRGYIWKLETAYTRINCRENFFSLNVVGDRSLLPETVVNSTSLNQFKGSLDRHLRAEMFVLIWYFVKILLLLRQRSCVNKPPAYLRSKNERRKLIRFPTFLCSCLNHSAWPTICIAILKKRILLRTAHFLPSYFSCGCGRIPFLVKM